MRIYYFFCLLISSCSCLLNFCSLWRPFFRKSSNSFSRPMKFFCAFLVSLLFLMNLTTNSDRLISSIITIPHSKSWYIFLLTNIPKNEMDFSLSIEFFKSKVVFDNNRLFFWKSFFWVNSKRSLSEIIFLNCLRESKVFNFKRW